MALDTNLTPEIVDSFNVYIDGVKAIGTAPEITLPQITSETIDVSGAGILGKISAPNIGQFESIEQEVSFNLVYSSFVNVLSPKRQVPSALHSRRWIRASAMPIRACASLRLAASRSLLPARSRRARAWKPRLSWN